MLNIKVKTESLKRLSSPDLRLLKSTDNRASMTDINTIRDSDFVSNYLERLTKDVKISLQDIRSLQGSWNDTLNLLNAK